MLAGLARSHNVRDVFVRQGIYFVDADCYSRMTRVRVVVAKPGSVVRHHTFENSPTGTTPHTTAPLDYLISGLHLLLDLGFRVFDSDGSSVLRGQTLDLAGALIAPLLGMMTCAFLGSWARRRKLAPLDATTRLPSWGTVPFFFAISPVLAHGTLLGRPDHQSLLILLLAVALAAELALFEKSSRLWALTGGFAWGASLWVSLYEPLVLLGLVALLWLGFGRVSDWTRERRLGLLTMLCVGTAAFLIEGWRVTLPDPTLRDAFTRWSQTIGELAHLDLRSGLLFRWLGWGIIALPFLVFLNRREDRRALPLGLLIVAALGLTIWQLRWGYFLALIFAMSLPWLLVGFRKPWLVWCLFVASLWPVFEDWDERLFPDADAQKQSALQRHEGVLLRQVANQMRSSETQPFLAPWWLSPALAYWSGQPGVAGSSHQSLPGILDSARFYLADDHLAAGTILRERKVHWVVADEASRVIHTSALLLGVDTPSARLAVTLSEHPKEAPPFLTLQSPVGRAARESPQFYRLYRVDSAKLQP